MPSNPQADAPSAVRQPRLLCLPGIYSGRERAALVPVAESTERALRHAAGATIALLRLEHFALDNARRRSDTSDFLLGSKIGTMKKPAGPHGSRE
jgi:hypothetical protein